MRAFIQGVIFFAAGAGLSRVIPWPWGAVPVPHPPASPALVHPGSPADAGQAFDLNGPWQPAAEARAKADPRGFLDWLVAHRSPPHWDASSRQEVLKVLFLIWVEKDPDEAFSAALDLPGDFASRGWFGECYLLTHMLNHLLDRPGGLVPALRWLAVLDNQADGSPRARGWLTSAPPSEIAAHLKHWLPARQEFPSAMIRLFSLHWSGQDAEAAYFWAQSLPPASRRDAMAGWMEARANTDPLALLQYLGTAPSGENYLASYPLRQLAQTEPRQAVEWCAEYWTGSLQHPIHRDLLGRWNRVDGKAAFAWCLEIPSPGLRRKALEDWSFSSSGADILAQLQSLPAASPERRLLLASAIGRTTDEATWDQLQQLIADPSSAEVTLGIVETMMETATSRDVAKALAYAWTLPETYRRAAVETVVGNGTGPGLTEAIRQIPEGDLKEAALAALKAADPSAEQ